MNSFLLLIIALPVMEIAVMIKIGQQVGAINTILLIFLTAIIGIYYARFQGLNTLKSAFVNIYKNKVPVYELISGASIAIGAFLLIIPGFITDTFGFLFLIPFSRKILINKLIKINKIKKDFKKENIEEAEVIEDKKDEL